MKDWIKANAKALTALFTSGIAGLAAHYALHLNENVETMLAALIVSALVYRVPNTPRPGAEVTTAASGTGDLEEK